MGVFGPVGKPQDVLQAKGRAPDRTLGRKAIIKCRRHLAPALGQGFVGERHDEAAFVVFRRLHRAPFGRGEGSETGDIHGPDIDGRLAINHPFGHAQADTAGLAETGHDTHGDPVVPHARNGADHRVAVGAEGEGPVDHVLDAGSAQGGDTLEAKLKPFGDMVDLGLQQLVTEIHRRATHRPWRGVGFIGSQQHAVAFLAEVHVAFVINACGQPFLALDNLGNVLGDQIVMFHGLHGQMNASHMADFARPQTAGIDDIFCVHVALLGHHIPAAVRALVGFQNGVMGHIGRTQRLGRLGIGIGHARGVNITIQRIPQGGDVT